MTEQEQLKEIELFFENMNYSFKARQNYKRLIEQLSENTSCYSNDIIKIIDEIVFVKCKDKFIRELSAKSPLFRARVIDIDDIKNCDKGIGFYGSAYYGYNEENSRECPLLIGGNGRNNIKGQSYLYAADDELTACSEIKAGLRQLISLARFETTKPLKLVDFSRDIAFQEDEKKLYGMSLGIFFTQLMFAFSEPVFNENEYRITQVISDYFRKTGIDGIAYRSFYTGKTNYTIFNCHHSYIKFVDSRLLTHQFQNSVFWDFTNKVAIKAETENYEYNEKVAEKIKTDLALTMKKG